MVGAVLIDRNGAMVADRQHDLGAGGDRQIGTAALELDIYKHTLAILKGAVTRATRVDTKATILEEHNIGEVLTAISIDNIWLENPHLLTTADKWSLRVDQLDNDIATHRADIKDSTHRYKILVLPHCYKNRAARRRMGNKK